jgi:biotin carboxylase
VKDVLVVDVGGSPDIRRTFYELIEEYGARLFFLFTNPAYEKAYPRCRVARAHELGAIVEAARAWATEERFEAVLAIHENSVIPGAAVAEALGLPGHSLEAARNSRNKYHMRQAYRAGGAPCPAFALVDDLEAARAAAQLIGFPAILKPTLGAGSEHVYRVDSMADLEQTFPLARAGIDTHSYGLYECGGVDLGARSLLLESFLDGSEHCMEAIIWDGELLLGSIADRLSKEMKTFDNDLYSTPTSLSAARVEQVREAVRRGAVAQGIRRGVLHAEVRFHQDQPHIVEIAARIGGGSLFRMARIAYGYCPLWAAYQVSLGIKPVFRELHRTGDVTVGLTMLCDGGRLEEVETSEEILRDPRIFNYQLVRKVGDVIKRPPLGNDMLGYIGTTGCSIDDAVDLAARSFERVRLRIAPQP